MTEFELLLENACLENINTIEAYDMGNTKIKGLYCDGTIAISSSISTNAEKSCILAEELGHHYTSSGNILDLNNIQNRKQERKARMWAYNQQIGLIGLVNIFKRGCQNRSEAADFLNVTEDFLNDAIECYRQKYGRCTTIDNYTIFFEPHLAVMEKI